VPVPTQEKLRERMDLPRNAIDSESPADRFPVPAHRLVKAFVTWSVTVLLSLRVLLGVDTAVATAVATLTALAFVTLQWWSGGHAQGPCAWAGAAQEPDLPACWLARLGVRAAQAVFLVVLGLAVVVVTSAPYFTFVVVSWFFGGAGSRVDLWSTLAVVAVVSCCFEARGMAQRTRQRRVKVPNP
jgi:hypothetical protein